MSPPPPRSRPTPSIIVIIVIRIPFFVALLSFSCTHVVSPAPPTLHDPRTTLLPSDKQFRARIHTRRHPRQTQYDYNTSCVWETSRVRVVRLFSGRRRRFSSVVNTIAVELSARHVRRWNCCAHVACCPACTSVYNRVRVAHPWRVWEFTSGRRF